MYMYMYFYILYTIIVHVHVHLHVHVCVYACVLASVFFISSYDAPLAQKASYLALHSSLFGAVVQLIMIILSLTALTLC